MGRTVFPCEEFSEVEVPADLLYVGSRIDIYPELSRFFDVDYRSGRIVLVAKSNVGLIPVNDRVAIHVIPRFPIANLFYVIQRAESKLRFAAGHLRSYDISSRTGLDPSSVVGNHLVEMLSHVRREGLLRRYVDRSLDNRVDGALMLSETVSRYYSAGIRHRQVRRVTELSSDIEENQLLKSAVHRLGRFYAGASDKTVRSRGVAATEALAQLFDGVSRFDAHPRSIRQALPQYIKRLPVHHRPYASMLWLAYVIETGHGLSIEKLGPATLDTFVVNLADVFEDYVRRVVIDNIETILPGYAVRNGNNEQVPLFVQGQSFKVKPDIYLTRPGKRTVVLDAKYKPAIKPPDRYEVMAFCEALGAKTAIVLSPAIGGPATELLGRTTGGIEFHIVRIDLGATDMRVAEVEFVSKIENIVSTSEL